MCKGWSSLWCSCVSPPKWAFITLTGCNNNYISYLWLFNVPAMLPVFDSPSTAAAANAALAEGVCGYSGPPFLPARLPSAATLRQSRALQPTDTRHEDRATAGRQQHAPGRRGGERGSEEVGVWRSVLRVCGPLKSSLTCKLHSIKRAFLL